MKHRLCLTELGSADPSSDAIELDSDRAHYLHRVLRLRVDAELSVFDGRGREWRARLTQSNPRHCALTVVELIRSEPPPTPLVLAQSWLKGGAMDTVVQKAVELGATAIWLLKAERSNVKLDTRRRDNKLAHLARIAMAAAEQSGAVWLPALTQIDSLSALLERTQNLRAIVLDLTQTPLAVAPEPEPLLLVVGPEGGWSESERAQIRKNEQVLTMGLGPGTLRAETAPLAALSAVRHSWGWRR